MNGMRERIDSIIIKCMGGGHGFGEKNGARGRVLKFTLTYKLTIVNIYF